MGTKCNLQELSLPLVGMNEEHAREILPQTLVQEMDSLTGEISEWHQMLKEVTLLAKEDPEGAFILSQEINKEIRVCESQLRLDVEVAWSAHLFPIIVNGVLGSH